MRGEKRTFKLNVCAGLPAVVFSFWISIYATADISSGADTPTSITSMLLTVLLIANYEKMEELDCHVRVLPGDTEDLALKAALFPSCTLLVSGNYQFRTTIPLYSNHIQGTDDAHFVALLPKAYDHDLIGCPDCIITRSLPEKATVIPVTAIFSPADNFSGEAFFEPLGSTSFQNIGIQRTFSELLPPVNLTVQTYRTESSSTFVNIGLANTTNSYSDKMPVIQEWGKHKSGRKYSDRRAEHQRGEQTKQPYKQPSGHSSKKGPHIAGDREPPRKPTKRDQYKPDEVDSTTISMILTLVTEILAGRNIVENAQSIRSLLKNTSWKTRHELSKNEYFNSLNKRYKFLPGFPSKTAKR